MAHDGKDRHPFPVPLKVYDETINVLKAAVQKAKLGREEELGALQRLDEQSRKLERQASGPSVEKLIADEFDRSHSYGGRSVFGWEPPPADSNIGENNAKVSQWRDDQVGLVPCIISIQSPKDEQR